MASAGLAALKNAAKWNPRTPGIYKRLSEQRGHANLGWLDSYHTFSFASYHHPDFENFGCLRVINEDRVLPNEGFGTHSHKNFDIFSYVVSGELEHRDSFGNLEFIHRGEVQMTHAGTGVSHSEYNRNQKDVVHFLQIWVKPRAKELKPAYNTMRFTDEQKHNTLLKIVSGEEGDKHILVNNDIHVFASILDKGVKLKHVLRRDQTTRRAYVQLVQTKTNSSIRVNDVELNEGDGAFVVDVEELTIEGTGDSPAEFLLFDLE
eukprot:TRINITY_DN3703_c0_g1_i1.p1 TRINITY_DN3703_c0_g1~~TRINITY_DN3703_c0_g1_i1.p1  ORF type:complete len:262 (-),score=38.98 TRINITY_DN3703_c0_g1_i1:46-831(-)